jgi:hypothetical protein
MVIDAIQNNLHFLRLAFSIFVLVDNEAQVASNLLNMKLTTGKIILSLAFEKNT